MLGVCHTLNISRITLPSRQLNGKLKRLTQKCKFIDRKSEHNSPLLISAESIHHSAYANAGYIHHSREAPDTHSHAHKCTAPAYRERDELGEGTLFQLVCWNGAFRTRINPSGGPYFIVTIICF